MYFYHTKLGLFKTNNWDEIPFYKTHHHIREDLLQSPEDGTAALYYSNGKQEWFENGMLHRLSGPASFYNFQYQFWYLNNKLYSFKDWILNHPNLQIYYAAIGLTNKNKQIDFFNYHIGEQIETTVYL